MKKTLLSSASLLTIAALSISTETKANELDKISSALAGGNAYVDARYRFETVDQSNITEDAEASTLRTVAGYKTGQYRGFTGLIEFENVAAIGDENYNDGGATASATGFPTVADPTGTELNQAFLKFDGIDGASIQAGRQKINRGNQRFIGSVGWRQNDQTYDGATLTVNAIPDTELFYAYSYNVNRIFGNDDAVGNFNGDIHIADATYSGLPFGKVSVFGHQLDIESPASQTGNANTTYGARFWGKTEVSDGVNILYDASYATQEDTGDNATSYDADYYHAEGGISFAGFTVKAGYEELGSDNGNFAFRTPLATLHKFNGWADQFLTTPAAGLEDTYASVAYKVNGVNEYLDGTKIVVAYHDFSPESAGNDYGSEVNAAITQKFAKHYYAGVKYADYDSDGNGPAATNDVEKLIFTLGIKFDQIGQALAGK